MQYISYMENDKAKKYCNCIITFCTVQKILNKFEHLNVYWICTVILDITNLLKS